MIFIPYTEESFDTATSYLSVADADEIITGQRNTSIWSGYNADVKEVILNQSSVAVDGAMMYQGIKISASQLLKFPRMETTENVDDASKVLPIGLKYAVATLCVQYSNDKAFKNITSETISKLNLSFKEGTNDVGAEILTFLKPLKATSVKIGTGNE